MRNIVFVDWGPTIEASIPYVLAYSWNRSSTLIPSVGAGHFGLFEYIKRRTWYGGGG
jgi:hypothetical protein